MHQLLARVLPVTGGTVLAQGRVRDVIDSYYASRSRPTARSSSSANRERWPKADGTLAVLAVNDLDDLCYATPAVGDGHLYVRTRSALYSFALVD